MQKILIVEDDPDIQELLTAYLRTAGYHPLCASDGLAALDLFAHTPIDLVLLDLMLPKLDGYGVCAMLRRSSSTIPIIMLTALDDEPAQLRGFDLQIDDYITKPFSMPLLLRKIEAVLRRSQPLQSPATLHYMDITLDLDAYEAHQANQPLDLTQREYELLRELITAPGRVFTRAVLLSKLWGYDFLGDERIVDSHIKNLRRKLIIDRIETVRGVGYRVAKVSS